MAYVKMKVDETRAFCEEVYVRHGFTREEAQRIVDVILMADLYGFESHGVQRMIRYHNSIIRGHVDPKAEMDIIFETPVSAVIDGNKTMGQITASKAMKMAIEKAKQHGFGMVTVRNCNHFGVAGYYSRMAADSEMIGFCSTNTEAIAIPTFGKKAMLGTSPIAVSMPADPYYFWFDCATTVVPRGKIEVYNKRGDALHEGWAADEYGRSCLDAEHVLDNINAKNFGGIFPIGGESKDTGSHKGYGYGLIAELFTGIISGGHTSPHVENGGMGDTSFGFAAIDYGIFGDKKEIRDRMSTLLRELRESPAADGQEKVYTPGEPEMISKADKEKNGILVNDKTVDEMRMIGEYVGLVLEDYIKVTEIDQ
ncbi:MAG: Ldh family oxidoreductase [Clostridiales bacterium]|nr:Ldh family oxidoreductase [Candidatus Blautia equi]